MTDITRVGVDVSCLLPRPLTGVGYYNVNLFHALMDGHKDIEIRLFAATARPQRNTLEELAASASRSVVVPFPTRLKIALWTRVEWPPLEWFVGGVDLVHGAFHLLPPSRRARRLVTVHDLTGFRHPETHSESSVSVHRKMLDHAVRRADAIIANSECSRRDLIELLGAPLEKTHVVYGGINLEEFQGDLDLDRLDGLKRRHEISGPYFIYVGTLEPRKNLVRLIEAYDRLRAQHSDCPALVLAGKTGWKFEPIFETIQARGLERFVVHTGYLERQDAVTLLKGAVACVYPSLYEGFGIPVAEAMAARVPVLTSNVSSLPEVIGDTGILIDPLDTESIQAGLDDLLERPGAAQDRAQAAYARVQQFTWRRSAQTLANLYRQLA